MRGVAAHALCDSPVEVDGGSEAPPCSPAVANPGRRILLILRNISHVRNFMSTIDGLLANGHEVTLVLSSVAQTPVTAPLHDHVEALKRRERFTAMVARPRPKVLRGIVEMSKEQARCALDYLLYFEDRLWRYERRRARAGRHVARPLRLVADATAGRPALRRKLRRTLAAVANRLPPSRRAMKLIERARPDLVVISPLVMLKDQQDDYVLACRRLGVPCCLAVLSWDNLTTKGMIKAVPDSVVVWNEAQAEEAASLHHVPAGSISVSGAYCYDHWFGRQPSCPEAAFKRRLGLAPDRPYLLFLGSSAWVAPDEHLFVESWVRAIRGCADPRLRDVAIVIRPHPQNVAVWERIEQAGFADVMLWPRAGANPVGEEARSDYFDTIHHSRLVVGVNSSSMVEAGVIGRAVFTVLTAKNEDGGEGSPHFRHLRSFAGGLLHVAATLEEHCGQLAEALASPQDYEAKSRQFTAAFVRPHGLDRPATPIFVEHLEMLARAGPVARR